MCSPGVRQDCGGEGESCEVPKARRAECDLACVMSPDEPCVGKKESDMSDDRVSGEAYET